MFGNLVCENCERGHPGLILVSDKQPSESVPADAALIRLRIARCASPRALLVHQNHRLGFSRVRERCCGNENRGRFEVPAAAAPGFEDSGSPPVLFELRAISSNVSAEFRRFSCSSGGTSSIVITLRRACVYFPGRKCPRGFSPGVIEGACHMRRAIRYLDDGELPIDNNHLENRIRPVALGRSNWLFAGSHRAGQRAATVMSLIQSAKLNGHDPYLSQNPSAGLRSLIWFSWKERGCLKERINPSASRH